MGRARELVCFVVLVGVLVLIPFLAENTTAFANYLGVMVFVGIFSLVTMGLSLLMGFAGQISLGHAAFFGLGAYSTGVLTVAHNFSPVVALIVGVLITSIVAYFVGLPTLKLKGHYLAMATLGIGIIVSIVFSEEVAITGGPAGLGDIPEMSFFGFALDSELKFYIFTWLTVFLLLIFSKNILRSRVGRGLQAIHFSEQAAEASGVDTSSFKLKVFVISAVYASIAGSLYAHYMAFLTPSSFDLFWSIKFLMMAVIGGMSSLWGAILGTGLITFLGNEWLHAFQDFDVLVYGVILLIISMFLPEGLAGGLARGWDRIINRGRGHA